MDPDPILFGVERFRKPMKLFLTPCSQFGEGKFGKGGPSGSDTPALFHGFGNVSAEGIIGSLDPADGTLLSDDVKRVILDF